MEQQNKKICESIKTCALALAVIASALSGPGYSRGYNTDESSGSMFRKSRPTNKDQKANKGKYSHLLNHKDKRFWREGNHRPDEAFVLFGQHPESVEFAKIWILRMSKKRSVLKKMDETLEKAKRELIKSGQIKDVYNESEYLGLTEKEVSRAYKKSKKAINSRVPKKVGAPKEKLENIDRYAVYFIYNPSCGACDKMAKTLAPFGKNVYPFELTNKNKPQKQWENFYESRVATKEKLNKLLGKTGNIPTPLTYIVNKKTRETIKLYGPHTKSKLAKKLSKI